MSFITLQLLVFEAECLFPDAKKLQNMKVTLISFCYDLFWGFWVCFLFGELFWYRKKSKTEEKHQEQSSFSVSAQPDCRTASGHTEQGDMVFQS